MLAQRALEAVAPEMKALAESEGLTYSTVKAWRAGIRTPSEANLARLAKLCDDRADTLRGIARELRIAADSTSEGDG